MGILKNQRWELFAQNVAKGVMITKAYQQAGYEVAFNVAQSNSSRLLDNPSVLKRVKELQERAANKAVVTIEKLTEELEEARKLAMSDEKGAAAAVSAIMAKAKLHGLDVIKADVNLSGGINITISSDDANL